MKKTAKFRPKFLDENYNLKNQKNDKDTQNFISSLDNKNVFQRT